MQTNMVTEADNTIRESEEALNGGISSPSIVNVQEMVRCNLSCIPDRFKRSEEDKSKDVDLSVLSPQIPVIDLALLSSENVEELKKLEWACKCWGFFMVILLFISLHFSMAIQTENELVIQTKLHNLCMQRKPNILQRMFGKQIAHLICIFYHHFTTC